MNRSSFPQSIDVFQEHFGISNSDLPLVKRFQELRLKENKTQAEMDELNGLLANATLRPKLFLEEDLNKLQDAMVNIETFTTQRITDYYKYMGTYSNTTTYSIFNSVTYTDGCVYLLYNVVGYTAGVVPTNASYWLKLSNKGDQGIQGLPGVGLVYKGQYSASTAYVKDNLVTRLGNTYHALQASTGIYPEGSSSGAYWQLFMVGSGEDLTKLQTTNKTSLVGSINEVKNQVDSLNIPTTAEDIGAIGKSIITASNDFIVGTGVGTIAKKTLVETKTILGVTTVETNVKDNTRNYIKKFDTDVNGIDTRIEKYRFDGTLMEKSVLSGGTSPNYTTRTVTFYLSDGVTIDGTPKVFTQIYVGDAWKGETPV